MRVLLIVLGGLVSGLIGLVGSAYLMEWRDRRKKARAAREPPPLGNGLLAQPPPPPPPPELPLEQRLRTALAQAVSNALREWVRDVRVCPACEATSPPSGVVVPVMPTPAPTPPGQRPPESTLPRYQGALEKLEKNHHRVYAAGPGLRHFHAFQQEIRCLACGWSTEFPHTHDPPSPHFSAPPAPDPVGGPRVVFVVTDHDGRTAGRVRMGGGEPVHVEVEPEAPAASRAAARLAGVLLAAARRCDLAALGGGNHDEVRREIVDRLLAFHGGRLTTLTPGA